MRAYCKEHEICEHSFYRWRQRLRAEKQPVSFALVDTRPATGGAKTSTLELVLCGGERLQVPCEENVLSVVLRTLRALG